MNIVNNISEQTFYDVLVHLEYVQSDLDDMVFPASNARAAIAVNEMLCSINRFLNWFHSGGILLDEHNELDNCDYSLIKSIHFTETGGEDDGQKKFAENHQ